MFASSINNDVMKLILTIKNQKRTTNRKGSSSNHPTVLEFTTATKSSSLIKNGFSTVIRDCPDCRRTGLLTRAVMQVMHSDVINNWGQRNVRDGDLHLLTGYEFNERNPVERILRDKAHATINPVTGFCLVTIPTLVPEDDLYYAGSYTHVRFTVAAGCFDFEQENCQTSVTRTAYLQRDAPTTIELAAGVPVRDGCPILLLLGIEFFKAVNGKYYEARYGGQLALQIMAVERGVVE
jgi:hypothetical protein